MAAPTSARHKLLVANLNMSNVHNLSSTMIPLTGTSRQDMLRSTEIMEGSKIVNLSQVSDIEVTEPKFGNNIDAKSSDKDVHLGDSQQLTPDNVMPLALSTKTETRVKRSNSYKKKRSSFSSAS